MGTGISRLFLKFGSGHLLLKLLSGPVTEGARRTGAKVNRRESDDHITVISAGDPLAMKTGPVEIAAQCSHGAPPMFGTGEHH